MGKPRLFRMSRVYYGAPIEFSEYYGKKLTEEDVAECEKRLRDAMIDMRKELIEIHNSKKKKKVTE